MAEVKAEVTATHHTYMTFERRVANGDNPDVVFIALCELIGELGGVMLAELPALVEAYKRTKADALSEANELSREAKGDGVNERN